MELQLCIREISFTEMSNQLIFSLEKEILLKSGISMFLYWWRATLPTPKQGPRIMQVHRFGITSPIATNAIFGPLAVLFMKCVVSENPSKPKILTNFIKKLRSLDMTHCRIALVTIWGTLLKNALLINLTEYH